MIRRRLSTVLLCVAGLVAMAPLSSVVLAADAPAPASALATTITPDQLDPAAFAEWVDGRTTVIGPERLKEGPAWVVWTTGTQPGWSGVEFGDTKQPGVRHLRLGFTAAQAVGTVVTRGDDLSVLRADAPYPGDLGDDRQWLPAQRLARGAAGLELSASAAREDDAVWVLPPGTTTRALRFTHRAGPTDRRCNGWAGGVWILPGRYTDRAVLASASASGNPDTAGLINDQRDNSWGSWDNGEHGQEQPVSPEHPAWVMLSWPTPQALVGLVGLEVGAGKIDVQVCDAPATLHPAQAAENQWRTVVAPLDTAPGYPRQLTPVALPFSRSETTRGVRLRFLAAGDESHFHPHLQGRSAGGKRVWLTELLALSVLGDAPLAAPPRAPTAEPEHPPIAVRFRLAKPGLVTLVIEDREGNRVRNLVSETPFPAGENVAWWDGLDDRGRDYEAALHHIYRIPGALVAPATYRVRGLVRDPLALAWQFSFYTNGNPPWETADGSGWWLANHTAPQAVCCVPGGAITGGPAASGDETVMVGSPVTEGGSGLAWLGLDGRKRYGIGWIGGIWTGAAHLARDRGPAAVKDWYAYAGSTFEDELRITGLRPGGGDGPVLKWFFPAKTDSDLTGIAAHDGWVVCSLPKLDRLLLLDGARGTVLGALPCAAPRGVAFDAQGRLLVLSGIKLLRMTLPRAAILARQPKPADKPQDGKPQDKANQPPLIDLAAPPVETVVAKGLEDPAGLCVAGGAIYVSDRGASHQIKVFGEDGKLRRTIGKPGAPTVGAYDPLHLNDPAGMDVDGRGRLWVAEYNHQPKRISVWKPDGTLDQAFYGPARYGEGGTIDSQDRRRLFLMGMELALDWDKGTSAVKNVFWRPGGLDFGGECGPEHCVHVQGREYLTTTFNAAPTNAPGVVGIWRYADGVAKPVAGAGRARDWAPLADAFGKLASFSVRWSGTVVPPVGGPLTFHTVSDDGVRVWVGGKLVIDDWTGHGPLERTATVEAVAGKPLDLRVEYFQGSGGATMRLDWSATGLPRALVPTGALTPAGAKAPGGLRGEYFAGTNLDQPRFTRVDPVVQLDPPGGVLLMPGSEAAAAAYAARLPAGADFDRDELFFTWSDRDHDGKVSPAEVTFRRDSPGGMTVQGDLSLATATGLLLKPTFDAQGVPLYDPATAVELVSGGRVPNTSGGGHTLVMEDGWTALTIPPAPFPEQSSLSGAKGGVARWTYPNLWPGLHPSHHAPLPEFPGEVIGTTRAVGLPFKPRGSDAGWCWAINGNKGNVYVFTSDGLFVATLFRDSRAASRWAMPVAVRGTRVDDTTLGEENFWPTITQTGDGKISLVSGSSVVSLDGLESIRRLPDADLTLSTAQLAQAQAWTLDQEVRRQAAQGSGQLAVTLRGAAPTVDGDPADWAGAQWATIDRRRIQEGDWGSRTELITGAVAVAGDRLYVAWRTNDGNLLRNAGTTWQTLFKSGGALDLMVGADGKADPQRAEPVAGDRRLLVALVEGKPVAVLYTPVVPGHQGERVPFASPVSTVLMDEVRRVDDQVVLAGKDGFWELSVPLALLGLKPAAGQEIKADIGLLRGNGFNTMQRVYWSNKATSITADVPSEARLSPNLWGRWRFTAPAAP